MGLVEQYQELESRFLDIERRMSDPDVVSDQKRYQELVRKHAELEEPIELFRDYQRILAELKDLSELQYDPDMKEMVAQERPALEAKREAAHAKLTLHLIPKDPNDFKNAIVEIRQGTGGDEAALFAAELYRMYVKFAEHRGWKTEALSLHETERGGIKEVVFSVIGNGAYSFLKFESGTHRVQRVPETESQGRVHTSAATVAILPEVEEVDIHIDPKDLRVDTFRASGAGGQHVNKTSSAVRITHIPTGVVVACQDERSQLQNKDKSMRMLRAKLYEMQEAQRAKTERDLRKSQVGSGDRSEKIRTYNFPQNRLTDHRINLTLYSLEHIMNGDLDDVVDALIAADQMAKMQAS